MRDVSDSLKYLGPELSRFVDDSLRYRFLEAVPAREPREKGLVFWLASRLAMVPASHVIGVGRVRPSDWLMGKIRVGKRFVRLKDLKPYARVPGEAGRFFVAVSYQGAEMAWVVDGLASSVDFDPRTLTPIPLHSGSAVILGTVRTDDTAHPELTLLDLNPFRSSRSL